MTREKSLSQKFTQTRALSGEPASGHPRAHLAPDKAPNTLRAQTEVQTVTDWAHAQPDAAWRRLSVRPGEKGDVIAEYLTRRVFIWDGAALSARCWHLPVRREIGGSKLKFCFANAKPQASLRRLASMQADRHFVERAFEDAKSAWRIGTSPPACFPATIWSISCDISYPAG